MYIYIRSKSIARFVMHIMPTILRISREPLWQFYAGVSIDLRIRSSTLVRLVPDGPTSPEPYDLAFMHDFSVHAPLRRMGVRTPSILFTKIADTSCHPAFVEDRVDSGCGVAVGMTGFSSRQCHTP